MSNVLSESILFTTVGIEADNGERGTGFLVGDTASTIGEYGHIEVNWERPNSKAYLVTAKHILGNKSYLQTTIECSITYNGQLSDGFSARSRPFRFCNEALNWAIHEDDTVDILVLDLTCWMAEADDGFFRFWPMSEIANPINLELKQSDAGDSAFVLGYPLRLRQGNTNLPIVRQGVLATSPRRTLTHLVNGQNLNGLLIDGAIMPGSSGSPVVITSERFLVGDLQQAPYRPLVVGVVAEEWDRGKMNPSEITGCDTKKSQNAKTSQPERYANLGFAHSGATIIETIARLGAHNTQDFLRLDHDMNWAAQSGIPEWALRSSERPIDAKRLWAIASRLRRDRARARGTPILFDEHADAVKILGDVPMSVENAQSVDDVVHALRDHKIES